MPSASWFKPCLPHDCIVCAEGSQHWSSCCPVAWAGCVAAGCTLGMPAAFGALMCRGQGQSRGSLLWAPRGTLLASKVRQGTSPPLDWETPTQSQPQSSWSNFHPRQDTSHICVLAAGVQLLL